MIIETNISKYIVFSEDKITQALAKMSFNKNGIVFSLSSTGRLEGVLTDGDVRRWLLSKTHINMEVPIYELSNKDFLCLPKTTPNIEIIEQFSERIKIIPLVDESLHLVSLAFQSPVEFKIGRCIINHESPSFIIAEIGNNHNGDINLAFKLVDAAVAAGADSVKFQLRDMQELYGLEKYNNNESEDLGSEYTQDILAKFQLSKEDLFKVFDYAKSKNIMPFCTPWDNKSLYDLNVYGVEAFKVASADLTNHQLLDSMTSLSKPIICSTGMATELEIAQAVKLFKDRSAKFILLHCNSTYPAPFKDINLKYMDRLKLLGSEFVGYSGHERGISIALAAAARGAKVIEKHFTLDRNMEGNDHRVSLLPAEFKSMVESIREVELALGNDASRQITQGEMMNREVLGKSLFINRDLPAGTLIDDYMLDIRSPGKGLSPNRRADVVGKISRRNFVKGEFIYSNDIDPHETYPRNYTFKRPFGIPIRYHDLHKLAYVSNFDLLEFHLSYRDLDKTVGDYFSKPLDMDFVVHCPELFAGDHLLDLSSSNEDYRVRSIDELKRVVDLTLELRRFFKKSIKPKIIINAGGFTRNEFMKKSDRSQLYEAVANSLSQLNGCDVEFIPQTMPPFPWHFGGQSYHNLFVESDEIVNFCEMYGMRICLDVSHSYLASNFYGQPFSVFLQKVGSYAAHLHIVDGRGVDGEGLQIGEGTIDFNNVSEILARVAPTASFIPEIWQGHKNGGAGFWTALDLLEKYF